MNQGRAGSLVFVFAGTNEELSDNKADNNQASPTVKFILPTMEENLPSSVS